MRGKKGNGRKYLAGYVDFGVLGRKEAFLFKNEKREKDTQPAFRLLKLRSSQSLLSSLREGLMILLKYAGEEMNGERLTAGEKT